MNLAEAQELVKDFHELIRVPVASQPTTLACEPELSRHVSSTLRQLSQSCRAQSSATGELAVRLGLALEELAEWVEANLAGDITAAADALGDRLYVLLGDAVSVGVPIERVFAAVHQSNMTKAATKLGAAGKGIKDSGYRPPDLSWLTASDGRP